MRYLATTARPILEDLAGTLVFYLLYLATASMAIAAGVGLALGLAQIARHLLRREAVPTLLMLGVGLTVMLAALSLATDDPRVLLLKPSIAYTVVGIVMLPRGWVVRYVPEIARTLLPARTFDRVGWSWAGLMFATAVTNLLLVRMLSPHMAAAVFVIWAIVSKLALFGGQYAVLSGRATRVYRERADAAA